MLTHGVSQDFTHIGSANTNPPRVRCQLGIKLYKIHTLLAPGVPTNKPPTTEANLFPLISSISSTKLYYCRRITYAAVAASTCVPVAGVSVFIATENKKVIPIVIYIRLNVPSIK